jgi:hypothetical protein
MFMLLRVEIHPDVLLVECIVGISSSYRCTSQKEAWMSINSLQADRETLRVFGG